MKFKLVIAFGLSLLAVAPSALAVEYGGYGLRPAFPRADNPRTESIFVHTLSPGQVQNESVQVINNTESEMNLVVYAADSTPSSGGGFACKQLSEEKSMVGNWISLEQSELVVPAHQKIDVPFTITVPNNAPVGEHNGCVLVQKRQDDANGQSGVSLSVRNGLRVAITVPGEIVRKLDILGFKHIWRENGNLLFTPSVVNSGNVSIDTNVKVSIKNIFGKHVIDLGGQYPVLRGDTAEWNFEHKPSMWGGWFKAQLFVEYDNSKHAELGIKSGEAPMVLTGPMVWFFVWPYGWALIIEIAVLILIFACGLLIARSVIRRRHIARTWETYVVVDKDDVHSVSTRYGISWRQLVKANKLKAPYTLKSGETIIVPPHAEK